MAREDSVILEEDNRKETAKRDLTFFRYSAFLNFHGILSIGIAKYG